MLQDGAFTAAMPKMEATTVPVRTEVVRIHGFGRVGGRRSRG